MKSAAALGIGGAVGQRPRVGGGGADGGDAPLADAAVGRQPDLVCEAQQDGPGFVQKLVDPGCPAACVDRDVGDATAQQWMIAETGLDVEPRSVALR